MYLINKEKNNIEPLEKVSFKSAGIRERKHLQEWIAKNPQSLGEELLIIQKEFSGFDDTNERLDLLALDKKGNMACILNAANEIAVEAFLNDKITFLQIAELNENCMRKVPFIDKPNLNDYIETDSYTRQIATQLLNK